MKTYTINFILRFTRNDHNFIRDNDYAIAFQIIGLFLRPSLKIVLLTFHVMCKYYMYSNMYATK